MEQDYNKTENLWNETDGVKYICEFLDFSTISAYVFIFITIISLLGNTVLVCVLVTHKNLKFVTKIFILNLACSDLIFTATLPFWTYYHLHHWIFGDFLCKFVTAAYFAGLYSSIFILTAMTVDRFNTVVLNNWPHNDQKKKKYAVVACVAAWIISFAASVYDANKMEVEDDYYCEAILVEELVYYFQVSLLFFLPFFIIIVCYCVILKRVFQATNKRKHKVVSVIFCIIAAYFICWGPYNILLFVRSLYKPKGCNAVGQLETTYNVCRILAFSHCCMNPLLCLMSQKLRAHLLSLLKGKTIYLNNRERSTNQNLSGIHTAQISTMSNSAVMLEMNDL